MSDKKPHPLQNNPSRPPCPVCGKVSYSLLGTHPQCAMRKASDVLHAAQKAAATLTAKPKVAVRSTWSK